MAEPGQAASNATKKAPVKCQACTSCRQKKVRCDGGKPVCTACQRSGADCQYVPSRRRG
ncbi:transcription activator AflR, partial [Martensiomyces pterosporus]